MNALPADTRMGVPAASIDSTPLRNRQLAKITVKRLADGRFYKAMLPGQRGRSEATMTLVGILGDKDLPPVRREQARANKAHLLRRQSANVYGFDYGTFEQAVQNIAHIDYKFITFVCHRGQDAGCSVREAEDDKGRPINFRTQYFTVGRHANPDHRVPFEKAVDPHNVLKDLESNTIVHSGDNDVIYLEYKDDRHRVKDPASFRTGDVVEVGFAMVAYRNFLAETGEHYKCYLVMRSLTLLDLSVAMEHHIANVSNKHMKAVQSKRGEGAKCMIDDESDEEEI
ncbi:hypothetical protein GGX14DRAFT_400754 [Mycena pura]|uniref:Uncharacterized protein n=1 Tax=Mycena pura TaxID=153505 RepID=A0AAD6V2J3_9AGAR|nr:hypothetical protein GGX14DRAFT_400754 [Mycena pura]